MAAELLSPERQPVIIAALRTPVCRTNGALRALRAHELLAPVLRGLIDGLGLDPASVEDVVVGNAVGGGGNMARLALLEAGLPVSVPGLTVDRQCGSGLDAIVLAARLVAAGGSPLYLAGGVESTSTAPLRAHRKDDGGPEFYSRAQFVPDSYGDPDMGVAAETVAREYGVGRDRQDAFALASHRKALAAASAGLFENELVPLAVGSGPVA
ncbi:MAG: acetyl-CoA C-acyltransferase, partial [Pseudarthrobacter sp.]|nr:acetyl-CoA C-acyltransferase [Pseudarthrobacter sp.]